VPPRNIAKLIMHQGQRLVSLAEDVLRIRPKRESMQVFFLVVCGEAVAKLMLVPKTRSGLATLFREFFSVLVPEPHRTTFGQGLTTFRHEPLGPRGA